MLSKGKTIPYGRTRGILFREKKKELYTPQDFLTSPVPTKEYIPICLIKQAQRDTRLGLTYLDKSVEKN